jgi:hypothetical protein
MRLLDIQSIFQSEKKIIGISASKKLIIPATSRRIPLKDDTAAINPPV